MVFPCLPSLLDLCSIRLAYLQWTRRLVVDYNCIVESETEIAALAAAQELPLPEKLQSLVVKHVRPTGGRLFSLLCLWLSKLPSDTPQKWLIGHMLFDCLILNADGLINQRRTAQTLLRNNILHNVLAFRLACINFLEIEVLKLWILVKEYFLKKIVREGNQHLVFQSYVYGTGPMPEDVFYSALTEPDEVLFWIGFCLSRENAVDITEVPHFIGSDVDWYEYALDCAVSSGNVACFEYFKSFRGGPFEYDCLDMIERILMQCGKCQHSSFIFHFMLLNFEEKSELFREFPERMVNQFLQWPLSQTFLQNTEEVWNLVPDADKDWVFSEVRKVLVFENVLLYKGNIYTTIQTFLTYCVEHLLGIWHALWNVSPDNYKSSFLDFDIFPDFEEFRYRDEFPSMFEASGLKPKLLNLFLSNGEAVLKLYQRATLEESLKSVVAEYMPEDFQDLERRHLSFFETLRMPLRRFKKNMEDKLAFHIVSYRDSPVNEIYLHYIKTVVFSSDRI